MESGWDVKHMVRLIVTSGTYRQVSTASKELLARDPQNRELARGGPLPARRGVRARQRPGHLRPARPRTGGPSVKPYQPAGYWENLNFPPREWEASKDDNQ